MTKSVYDQLLEHDDKQLDYWTKFKQFHKSLGDHQIEVNYANKQIRRIKKTKEQFLQGDRADWL